MKQSFINPARRQEWREALMSGAVIAALLIGFSTMLVWDAQPALIDGLSATLNFRFGLSACAKAFSSMLLGATIFSVMAGNILVALAMWGLFQAFTEKRNVALFAKSSVGMVFPAFFLLFPLISGDGIWSEGRRRSGKLVLESACIRSHVDTLFRLDIMALIIVGCAVAALAYQLFLNRASREGWSALPETSAATAAAVRQEFKERAKRKGWRIWLVAKWAITAYAAIAVGLAVGSTRLTIEKAYRGLTWDQVQVPVVGAKTYCVIERDRTGKGRQWTEDSSAQCSPETLAAIREDLAARTSPPAWRVSTKQSYILRFTGPQGQVAEREVWHDYVPDGTPVGALITVVQDPANPGYFDTGFTPHQWERALSRLKMLLVAGLAIYLLHFHKWRMRPPSGHVSQKTAPAAAARIDRFVR